MLFDLDEVEAEESAPPRSLSDYDWVKGTHLSLNKYDFDRVKAEHTKEEFFTHVSRLVHELQLPFPYFPYSRDQQAQKFGQLSTLDTQTLAEDWENNLLRVTDKRYRGEHLLLPTGGMSGNSLSDMFTQKVRLSAVQSAYVGALGSIVNVWDYMRENGKADVESVRRLLRNAYLEEAITEKTIIRAGRISGQMVTQFRPRIAKDLYNFFGAKKVLDFSAGWGDRLVGFLASNAESYIGIDPNTALHEPYRQIADFYDSERDTRFICEPAEDVDYSSLSYDFVFTSPPYFDTEVYTDEPTQSMSRYTKEESWKHDFLFKTLTAVYGGLSEGGRVAINICDNTRYSVTEDLIKHMESLGATYEGVIGYEINKRPGFVRDRSSALRRGEPIFIWSKGEAPAPTLTREENFFGV